jgi:MYXO-CTERM domain-containing protein
MRGSFRLAAGLAVLLVSGAVWGTTYHSVSVDGNLADFTSDETTAGDGVCDSLYGTDNCLSTLYVTWDAQTLYLGFDYKMQGGAVMYLVDAGKAGGATNLCPGSGYSGSFPANVQGAGFNLMVAFWVDQANPTVKPVPFVFALSSSGSTLLTTEANGVLVSLVETVNVDKRTGSVEAAIPWDAIYGLGSGKVPANAKLKIAGVIRGKNDGDGLGDVSPNQTNAASNMVCTDGNANYLDKFIEETVDANGDQTPEVGWAPGPNKAASAGDVRLPDARRPDAARSDRKISSDGTSTSDRGANSTVDGSARTDRAKATTRDQGCSCATAAGGSSAAEGSLMLVLLLGLLALSRRRGSR